MDPGWDPHTAQAGLGFAQSVAVGLHPIRTRSGLLPETQEAMIRDRSLAS
jgi:hypothetical protein